MRWIPTNRQTDHGEQVLLENRFRWWSRIKADVFRYPTTEGMRYGYSIKWPPKFRKYPRCVHTYNKGMLSAAEACEGVEEEVKKFKEIIR